jgi:hypothetical protein
MKQATDWDWYNASRSAGLNHADARLPAELAAMEGVISRLPVFILTSVGKSKTGPASRVGSQCRLPGNCKYSRAAQQTVTRRKVRRHGNLKKGAAP